MKPNMYSFSINNSKHKKTKGISTNVVEKIDHSEYKDVC